MSNFYRYFKENMSALGLPAPESLFGTVQTTVGTVTVLLGLIDKWPSPIDTDTSVRRILDFQTVLG